MQFARSNLTCSLLLGLILGCYNDSEPQPAVTPARGEASKRAPAPKADPAQPSAMSQNPAATPQPVTRKLPDPLRGKVKETVDSGGYTYILLACERGDVWAAAKQFTVAVGDDVEIAGTMPMYNFHSPTLDRTFEEIQFASRARVIGGSTAAEPARPQQEPPPQSMPPGHPPIGKVAAPPKSGPSAAPKPGEIETLSGGLTVAELFHKKADLRGKPVKFRGRVVKANRGILAMNWLHIQDGTGEPGSNDITVTSKTGFAPPGSVVVVEGTLGLEKDFGAGYTYDVIVEDATVTIEPPKPSAAQPDAGKAEPAVKPADAEKPDAP